MLFLESLKELLEEREDEAKNENEESESAKAKHVSKTDKDPPSFVLDIAPIHKMLKLLRGKHRLTWPIRN